MAADETTAEDRLAAMTTHARECETALDEVRGRIVVLESQVEVLSGLVSAAENSAWTQAIAVSNSLQSDIAALRNEMISLAAGARA